MRSFIKNGSWFETYLSIKSDTELVTALQEVAYRKIPSIVIRKLSKNIIVLAELL